MYKKITINNFIGIFWYLQRVVNWVSPRFHHSSLNECKTFVFEKNCSTIYLCLKPTILENGLIKEFKVLLEMTYKVNSDEYDKKNIEFTFSSKDGRIFDISSNVDKEIPFFFDFYVDESKKRLVMTISYKILTFCLSGMPPCYISHNCAEFCLPIVAKV